MVAGISSAFSLMRVRRVSSSCATQPVQRIGVGGTVDHILLFDQQPALPGGASLGPVIVELLGNRLARGPCDPAGVALRRGAQRIAHGFEAGRFPRPGELAERRVAAEAPPGPRERARGCARRDHRAASGRPARRAWGRCPRIRSTLPWARPVSPGRARESSAARGCRARSSCLCTSDPSRPATSRGPPRARQSCSGPGRAGVPDELPPIPGAVEAEDLLDKSQHEGGDAFAIRLGAPYGKGTLVGFVPKDGKAWISLPRRLRRGFQRRRPARRVARGWLRSPVRKGAPRHPRSPGSERARRCGCGSRRRGRRGRDSARPVPRGGLPDDGRLPPSRRRRTSGSR